MTSPGLSHSRIITIFIYQSFTPCIRCFKEYNGFTIHSQKKSHRSCHWGNNLSKGTPKGCIYCKQLKGINCSIIYKYKYIVIAIHSSIYHETLTEVKHPNCKFQEIRAQQQSVSSNNHIWE